MNDECQVAPSLKTESDYQDAARQAWFDARGCATLPYAWFTPTCGTGGCVSPDHIYTSVPKHLRYPSYVCVYCGDPGFTKDHILPEPWTGKEQRKSVITVPACGQCSSFISDAPVFSITSRRGIAHRKIEKKYRKYLRLERRSTEELAEYGPLILDSIRRGEELRELTRARLLWPRGSAYDLRAMAASDVDDPYAVGLLTAETDQVFLWDAA